MYMLKGEVVIQIDTDAIVKDAIMPRLEKYFLPMISPEYFGAEFLHDKKFYQKEMATTIKHLIEHELFTLEWKKYIESL